MSDLIERQSKLKFKQHQDALDWSEEAVTRIAKLESSLEYNVSALSKADAMIIKLEAENNE